MERCAPAAGEKNIVLHGPGGAPVSAKLNARLLEQAVFNLVDNAVKYSAAGTAVTLAVGERQGDVTIEYTDRLMSYIERCAEQPTADMLNDLVLPDAIRVKEGMSDFFVSARKDTSTAPTN